MGKIKFFVMDVDGTLTDGKIYMGSEGEIMKAFDIKDGAGIYLLLPKFDILPVIITARESKILEKRCKELNITELHQGVKDKLKILEKILVQYDEDMSSVAYAGDDLPDIPCMEIVKRAGGVVLCPVDAISEVKALADFVSGYKAGDGAIRDCINYLVQQNRNFNIDMQVQNAVKMILSENFSSKCAGKYIFPNGIKYVVQEYKTKKRMNA